MTLLQLNTSLFSDAGQSSQLADRFVAGRKALDRELNVVVRDLARTPVPHLTAERFQAFLAKPEARTPEQQAIVAQSDALIDELEAADTIVIGLPMYNFGVPSMLKAYFDHVARAGVTFRYTETGPVGLLDRQEGVRDRDPRRSSMPVRRRTSKARTCASSSRSSASPTSNSSTRKDLRSAMRARCRRSRRPPRPSNGSTASSGWLRKAEYVGHVVQAGLPFGAARGRRSAPRATRRSRSSGATLRGA